MSGLHCVFPVCGAAQGILQGNYTAARLPANPSLLSFPPSLNTLPPSSLPPCIAPFRPSVPPFSFSLVAYLPSLPLFTLRLSPPSSVPQLPSFSFLPFFSLPFLPPSMAPLLFASIFHPLPLFFFQFFFSSFTTLHSLSPFILYFLSSLRGFLAPLPRPFLPTYLLFYLPCSLLLLYLSPSTSLPPSSFFVFPHDSILPTSISYSFLSLFLTPSSFFLCPTSFLPSLPSLMASSLPPYLSSSTCTSASFSYSFSFYCSPSTHVFLSTSVSPFCLHRYTTALFPLLFSLHSLCFSSSLSP